MTEAEIFAVLRPCRHGPPSEAAIRLMLSGDLRQFPHALAFAELVLRTYSPSNKDQRMGELLYRWQEATKRKANGHGRNAALVKKQLRASFPDLTDDEFAYSIGGHAAGRYYRIAREFSSAKSGGSHIGDADPDLISDQRQP